MRQNTLEVPKLPAHKMPRTRMAAIKARKETRGRTSSCYGWLHYTPAAVPNPRCWLSNTSTWFQNSSRQGHIRLIWLTALPTCRCQWSRADHQSWLQHTFTCFSILSPSCVHIVLCFIKIQQTLCTAISRGGANKHKDSVYQRVLPINCLNKYQR